MRKSYALEIVAFRLFQSDKSKGRDNQMSEGIPLKAFSFKTDKGILQIGVEFENVFYNFSRAWELYKEIKNNGRGPSLSFLQVMVEADFFR